MKIWRSLIKKIFVPKISNPIIKKGCLFWANTVIKLLEVVEFLTQEIDEQISPDNGRLHRPRD